ncbi:MAG: radical SAM protein [Thermoanaerobaculales bacterium]|jgi:radical SAM superfamily enzyme YgiQ (UPF0313 family)|nr:radical SAM protein [Thermoanaerobaculales bacterium]
MLILWPVHQLEAEHSQYPGIMTLSAVLKDNGFRSEVVPTDVDLILDRLRSEERAVLAFSTPSALANTYVDFNRRIKARRPDLFSVFGGAHPTYFPELVEEEGIDGICMGEGEYALLDLIRALDEGQSPNAIENWWIKHDGVIHRNPLRPLIEDLDELPLPDRAAFSEALAEPTFHAIVMTGRGCPYGCTYCYNHLYRKLYHGKGKLVRRRSVEHVIRELRLLKNEGARFIRFMDDLFTLQPEWVKEFSRRYRNEIGLPFTCLVRANCVDQEVIADLDHAGCHRIMMGIEAGNERLRRDVLKRRMLDADIVEAGRIIRDAGIRLVTANILAIPGGDLATDWETVDLNVKVRPDYASAAILHAFPGTEIHEIARTMGLLREDHIAAVSEGGFGFTSALNFEDPREKRQIENLHKFFPLVVRFPWLKPVVRQLIKLPPNRLFSAFYLMCVNLGNHLIAVPPRIGVPMMARKWLPSKWFFTGRRRTVREMPGK